ncbi:MAG: shikimate dehydrogenase, partial [Fulvivirga sp.]|nr:shikimate dehydrogenase [Fulvivirga sp.]
MVIYGLIGKKLTHSFSQKYFTEKFKQLNLSNYSYQLFELNSIEEINKILQNPEIKGLNITIPYKE